MFRGATRWLTMAIIVAAADRVEAGNLTVYNDSPSFQAATTGLSDVTFNGIVPAGEYTDYFIPSGYTDAATGTNFTFLNADGSDINVTSATYYSVNFIGPVFPVDFLNSSSAVPTGASELITLPASSTAVGFYYSTYDTTPITFTLSNGDTYTAASPPGFGNVAFLGFTDTTSFTSLTINDPTNSGILLMNFEFGTAVPEPSSLVLAGTAGLGLWTRRRRG